MLAIQSLLLPLACVASAARSMREPTVAAEEDEERQGAKRQRQLAVPEAQGQQAKAETQR